MLGSRNAPTLGTMNTLAVYYGQIGRVHDSTVLHPGVEDVASIVLGRSHLSTLVITSDLTHGISHLSQKGESFAPISQDCRCSVLGARRPSTFIANSIGQSEELLRNGS